MVESWQNIAARKVQEQLNRIPQDWRLSKSSRSVDDASTVVRSCGILTSTELELTESLDATAMLGELASGRVQSEDLTRAYCKRAAIATQLTNCLTEILFEPAIVRARELDSYLKKHGRPIGPLHGLPISMKDSFNIKGYDSSLGVAALCFKPADSNSPLVELLLSLGAVLYCKTNIPQTLSSLDSHNNIFGRVLNPVFQALTAGGSSGGEGALLAFKGSPLGVGTDIGGSIRVPAMCNGLYGVKPSHGRVPYAGQQQAVSPDGVSRLTLEPTAGPIARSMRDCETFLRAIADAQPESMDANVFAQPWSLQPALGQGIPLRVGIIRTDGHVEPLPCVRRLMSEVADKLRSQRRSIEVIEIDASTLLSSFVKTFNGIMSVDGANKWFDVLEAHGEPLSPWLDGRLKRRPKKDVSAYQSLQMAKHAAQTEALKLWRKSGGLWQGQSQADRVDVIVCPPAPHPVAPIDGWNTVNYTAAWNLLDYPAGIVPIRAVTEQDIAEEADLTPPLNGWDKINRELWTKVDRRVYLGSPLSIQCVTPKLEERRLVESMAILSESLAAGGAANLSRL